jgi:alkylation response protein AidB-like acyl-CoA dehydrogenase
MGLRVMRHTALRTLSQAERSATSDRGPELGREAMIGKLYWATWHRDLGELAMDVLGPDAEIADGEGIGDLSALQRLFLFSRSDTIYAGTNEIQRNLIGERALGLPPEPKPVAAPKAVAGGTPGPA